jgi:phospholipid/cholesterol/gamma-HCH transport system permease protein
MKRFFEHFGKGVLMITEGFRKPENLKVYWIEFMEQCNDIGIGSLPIVLIISLFMGMVMTVQFAYQLISPLVPKSVIGTLVRDSTILEFSPTLVCIVLAGVIGSKISSELGNMRVSEQIDALEVMGINTKSFLVIPKVFAGMIMIPSLIIISIAVSIWGGYLAGMFSHILTRQQFFYGLTTNFNSYNLFFAIVKSFTFSLFISIIPSYYGYYVEGGALEIGRASTTAVVLSCIMILCADYGLSILLL